jgi:UrcA family protein
MTNVEGGRRIEEAPENSRRPTVALSNTRAERILVMHKFTIHALAVFSLAATGTTAAAETISVTVSYEYLNLSSEAGVARLQARVRAAVGRVCGKPEMRQLRLRADHDRCKREAMNAASEQIARAIGNERTLALLGKSKPRG